MSVKLLSIDMKGAALLFLSTIALMAMVISCSGSPASVKAEKPHSDRVYNHDLSDKEHDDDDDDDDHSYDHDAFLGKEEAGKFDKMSPEESKTNLGKLIEKIDKDNDGFVTEKELSDWIEYISKRYIVEDSKRQFKDFGLGLEDKLGWDLYKTKNFGKEDPEADSASAKSLARDQRRWKLADQDGDGLLSLQEFTDFSHPEEAKHMRTLVGLETLEDMDKNKDGSVDVDEYIADMWTPSDSGEKEPDWVQTERETFKTTRDKNSDNKLDQDEVTEWIVPTDYNHVQAETKHLISQADADKDGKLSKDEIMDKHDVFVGSQATDFGEALGKHDEL